MKHSKLSLEMPVKRGRAAFTRTEYEKEVTRLEESNLNLQFRVAQLEEALTEAGMNIDSLQDPPSSQANRAGAKRVSSMSLGEMSQQDLVAAQDAMDLTRKALEEEWRTVQKVHDEVELLKADIQMGKLPAEPQVTQHYRHKQ